MTDFGQILYYVMAVSAFSGKKGMSQKDGIFLINKFSYFSKPIESNWFFNAWALI
jgi:hypothetical protein